jgi:diguanylate cyclase (GGDEF)-like protein/hemerythrin-like metal-binding protein/PAS domain S-box-containing protein
MYNYEKFFVKSAQAYALCKLVVNKEKYDAFFIDVNIAFGKMFQNSRAVYIENMLLDTFADSEGNIATWQKKLKKLASNRDKVTLSLFNHKLNEWFNFELILTEENNFIMRATHGVVDNFTENEIEEFTKINLDILCVMDYDGFFFKTNKIFEETLGYSFKNLEGLSIYDLINPEDTKECSKKIKRTIKEKTNETFITRFKCKNNRYKYIEWKAVESNGMIYLTARDISKMIKQEKLLRKAATTDFLTKLYNRKYFYSIAEKEISNSDIKHNDLILGIFDIDDFKLVNDVWGHAIGDKVLIELAQILKEEINSPNLISRLGGDEFLILIEKNLDKAMEFINHLQITISNHYFESIGNITCSYGIAKRLNTESFKSWYRRADEALYEAKKTGRNKIVLAKNKFLSISSRNLEWNNDWNCANEKINEHHKALFENVKQLMCVIDAKKDKNFVMKEINDLFENIYEHFEFEEAVMFKIGYPKVKEHIKRHEVLLEIGKDLISKYLEAKIDAQTVFAKMIDEFFNQHIEREDTKYFSYLEGDILEN